MVELEDANDTLEDVYRDDDDFDMEPAEISEDVIKCLLPATLGDWSFSTRLETEEEEARDFQDLPRDREKCSSTASRALVKLQVTWGPMELMGSDGPL